MVVRCEMEFIMKNEQDLKDVLSSLEKDMTLIKTISFGDEQEVPKIDTSALEELEKSLTQQAA